MALLKLHELAVANKLVERYEKVEDEKNATAGPQKQLKVVLFLGNRFTRAQDHFKAAKQQAAAQALQNTNTKSKAEKIASINNDTRKMGVTATGELYEWSLRRGVYVDSSLESSSTAPDVGQEGDDWQLPGPAQCRRLRVYGCDAELPSRPSTTPPFRRCPL